MHDSLLQFANDLDKLGKLFQKIGEDTMRCKACNTLLMDYESRRKDPRTKEYLDMCNECFQHRQAAIYGADADLVQGVLEDIDLNGGTLTIAETD